MTNTSQSQPMNCTPFVRVLKTDAAEILRVHPRTIDNYITQGLLPKPKQFGSREMWHPDVFYGHLSTALLGEGQPEVVSHPYRKQPIHVRMVLCGVHQGR